MLRHENKNEREPTLFERVVGSYSATTGGYQDPLLLPRILQYCNTCAIKKMKRRTAVPFYNLIPTRGRPVPVLKNKK